MNSPVAIQVKTAQERAITTSQVAQRSAAVTMGALFSSASSARRTIRCRELSALKESARIVKVPYGCQLPPRGKPFAS